MVPPPDHQYFIICWGGRHHRAKKCNSIIDEEGARLDVGQEKTIIYLVVAASNRDAMVSPPHSTATMNKSNRTRMFLRRRSRTRKLEL
jgi:hypothetical protein